MWFWRRSPRKASRQSGGGNVAIYNGEPLFHASVIGETQIAPDIAHREHPAAVGESEDILQIVTVKLRFS